jgi:hypothetical protein
MGVLVPPVTELFTQRLGIGQATTAADGFLPGPNFPKPSPQRRHG